MPSREPRPDATPGRSTGRDSFAAVQVTSAGPPVARWAGVIVLLLALAIAKPWGTPDGGPQTGTAAAPRGASAQQRAPLAAASGPAVDGVSVEAAVEAICLDPLSWRVATVERWRDQTIRVWRAIEPRTAASGPEDGRVPIMPLVTEGVIELGWCAPVSDAVRMSGNAVVEVWRRTASGVSPVTLTRQRPGPTTSPFGALYGSPAAPRAALWNDGTYVFHQRDPNGAENWFGVELERRPPTSDRG